MLGRFDLSQTSPAAAGVSVGTAPVATGLDAFSWVSVEMLLRGGTGGILNVSLQTSDDGGILWTDWYRGSDLAAGAAAGRIIVSNWSGAGAPIVVGQDLVPALAKGTVRPGPVGARMRAVFECGAGMSAGAAQAIFVKGYKASG